MAPSTQPGGPNFGKLATPLGLQDPGAVTLPPEILQGIEASGQQIADTLNAFAQVTPMHGALLGQIQELLTKYLQQVRLAGAPPPSPTATGSPFPGGGFERGGAAV